MDSLENTNITKCQLRQIEVNKLNLYLSTPISNCKLASFAHYLGIVMPYDDWKSRCNNTSPPVDDCLKNNTKNQQYMCANEYKIVRKSTWVTGDPHVFSYNKDYEPGCSFNNKQLVLFNSKQMKIFGKDLRVTNAPGGITQLSSLTIQFFTKNETNKTETHTFNADQDKMDNVFDSTGTKFITSGNMTLVSINSSSFEDIYSYTKVKF
jgi:hypothetical protein